MTYMACDMYRKSHVYIERDKCVKDWCETRMGVFYNLIMWYIISKFRGAWKFHSISWRTYSSCLCLCIAPALQILVCNCISISTRFAQERDLLSFQAQRSFPLLWMSIFLLCFIRAQEKRASYKEESFEGRTFFLHIFFSFLFCFDLGFEKGFKVARFITDFAFIVMIYIWNIVEI